MADRLQHAGYQLIVHDLHRKVPAAHIAAGAIWAATSAPRRGGGRRRVYFIARAN